MAKKTREKEDIFSFLYYYCTVFNISDIKSSGVCFCQRNKFFDLYKQNLKSYFSFMKSYSVFIFSYFILPSFFRNSLLLCADAMLFCCSVYIRWKNRERYHRK
jgi:hypothetical protein